MAIIVCTYIVLPNAFMKVSDPVNISPQTYQYTTVLVYVQNTPRQYTTVGFVNAWFVNMSSFFMNWHLIRFYSPHTYHQRLSGFVSGLIFWFKLLK